MANPGEKKMGKKMRYLVIGLFAVVLFLGCAAEPISDYRFVENFDENWSFNKGDLLSAYSVIYDDQNWQKVNLPHDWAIDGPIIKDNPSGNSGGYFPGGIGWYRKHFHIDHVHKGKRILVQFDGIYRNSDVWINGEHVGHHFDGYVSHYYDITPFVQFGTPNIIAVQVDVSQQPTDRWYSGAGIYRHVWLKIVGPVHVPIWGTYITTPHVEKTDATVRVETDVVNEGNGTVDCKLVTNIYNPNGKKITSGETEFRVSSGDGLTIRQTFQVYVPKLWSPNSPALYSAISYVFKNDKIVDAYKTSFGIRKVTFDTNQGFLLNDKKVVMKGVNLHHDGGSVGAAVPEGVWERRLQILKNMGVNAVRLAHNPHAPEVLDLCDSMGFLVYDEMYDKWNGPMWGQTRAPENEFQNRWKKDLTDFITRDRNHPSVVIWSVGNEVGEQLSDPETAVETYNSLAYHVHQQEPTRMVTCALHPGNAKKGHENPSRLLDVMDIVSYNYQTKNFERWRLKNPSTVWIAAETKAYQPETPSDWTKINFLENSWFHLKDWAVGQFIWAGIDYLGESRGWPDKGIRSGLVYTTGFRKPHSYFTESLYSEKPMVHITVLDDSLTADLLATDTWQDSWYGPPLSDFWSFPEKEGKIARVFTFTHCDNVELILNNQSLGIKQLSDFPDNVVRWELPYQKGRIEAIGYIDGKKVARHLLRTAGKASRIELEAHITKASENSKGLAQIEIAVVDRNGTLVPRNHSLVEFTVKGPAKIIGLDNGDMSDHTGPKSNTVECRGGRCLVIVQSTEQAGQVELLAKSLNLLEKKIKISFN
jgi:beta-galactosidase